MAHATQSRSPRARLAAALAVALAMLLSPGAALAGPATDEYKLDLPGVERASLENIAAGEPREQSSEQLGVVAEAASAEGPLEAGGSALEAAPLIVASLLAVGLIAIAARLSRFRGVRT